MFDLINTRLRNIRTKKNELKTYVVRVHDIELPLGLGGFKVHFSPFNFFLGPIFDENSLFHANTCRNKGRIKILDSYNVYNI